MTNKFFPDIIEMKKYTKPSIEVVSLRIKEDIAKVPTTFYKKGSGAWTKAQLKALALNDFKASV